MVTRDELRRTSELAASVISALFDAHQAARRFENRPTSKNAKAFADSLYLVEAAADAMRGAMPGLGIDHDFFASGAVVDVLGRPASSVHTAILDEGWKVADITLDLLTALRPGKATQVIVERPVLPTRVDLLKNSKAVLRSFRSHFASEDQLIRSFKPKTFLSALLEHWFAFN